MFSILDEQFMQRCLQLAAMGGGYVAPNPLVGCVMVKEGRVIGEGFHRQFGSPHAEVEAVKSAFSEAEIERSTVYVNLEPCSHYGKTPPCADMLVRLRPSRVVIAQADPNPVVAGKGIARLRDAGIIVESGLLEKEARYLNRKFNSLHQQGRPWITLKWAQSADGFIGPDIQLSPEEYRLRRQISGPEAARFVHRLRAENMAIMVGYRTFQLDKPQLNTRYWPGPDPIKFVFTVSKGRNAEKLPKDYFLIQAESPDELMAQLRVLQIHSLLVEGGKSTLEFFLINGLWDEAFVIAAEKLLENGTKSPEIKGISKKHFTFGDDRISHYIRQDI